MDQKITLGAAEYSVAPLSIFQMRRVGPCFSHIGIDTMEGMDAQLTIICEGIKAADPTFNNDKLNALIGVTFEQIRTATEVIGTLCGLKFKKAEKGGDAAGEAAPAPGPAESAA